MPTAPAAIPAQRWPNIIMVFGGGNALGAFHGGAYQAAHEHGIRPHIAAGSSIGAVTAALIAGNAADARVDRLRTYWDFAATPTMPLGVAGGTSASRFLSAVQTRLFGRPGLFELAVPRLFEAMPAGSPALYRTEGLGRRLSSLVDFDRLRDGPCRLVVNTTDLSSGQPVVFRSDTHVLSVDHVRASAALPGDFEPIRLDGRVLGDGGLTSNVPVEAALSPFPAADTLCIALDLFDRRSRHLSTLDDMNQRRVDIMFATQAEKDIELVRLRHEQAAAGGQRIGSVLLIHLVYGGADDEIGQKEFDYSDLSIEARWRTGYERMQAALGRIDPAEHAPGFRVIDA
jgi:NTE family protein